MDGMNFSVRENDVILSLLIYDRYLNVDTGMELFTHLFEKADHYDNILVEEYGAYGNTKRKSPRPDYSTTNFSHTVTISFLNSR